jgi:hypothetical protein
MRHHGIVGTTLELFGQPEIGFGHLEEYFDVPALTVDADHLFIWKLVICGKER